MNNELLNATAHRVRAIPLSLDYSDNALLKEMERGRHLECAGSPNTVIFVFFFVVYSLLLVYLSVSLSLRLFIFVLVSIRQMPN